MSEIKIGSYTLMSQSIADKIENYDVKNDSQLARIDKNGDMKITDDELVDFIPSDNISDIDEELQKQFDYYNKQAAIYETKLLNLQNSLTATKDTDELDSILSQIDSTQKKIDDIGNEMYALYIQANEQKKNEKADLLSKFKAADEAAALAALQSTYTALGSPTSTEMPASPVSATEQGTSVSSTSSGTFGSTVADIAKSYVGKLKESDGSYKEVTGGRAEAWCADFVTYVVNQASKQTGVSLNNFGSPSVSVLRSWGQANGCYGKTSGMSNANKAKWIVENVKPGDIMIQKDNGASHTGIVTKVNADGSFETVEGNTSDQCLTRKYQASSKKLSGFISIA